MRSVPDVHIISSSLFSSLVRLSTFSWPSCSDSLSYQHYIALHCLARFEGVRGGAGAKFALCSHHQLLPHRGGQMDKQEWEGIGALEQTALALDWSSTCANALLLFGFIWQAAMQWICGSITDIWQTIVQQKCKYVVNLTNCATDLQRTRPLYYNCSSNLTSEQGDLTCGWRGRGIHYLRFWLNPCGCKSPHITNFSLYQSLFNYPDNGLALL